MAQEVSVVKFDAIESLLSKKSDKLIVINFWATWCGPCIKEMPYFEAALDQYNERIELYFVSLDYADQIDRVKNFVSKKSIDGRVMILDELDYDTWIDRVDSSWSGAIPATLFIDPSSGDRAFVESELTPEEITNYINTFSN